MNSRIISLSLLALCLAAVPAMAGTYDNGPLNGNTDAWNIAFGFAVSDTFQVLDNGPVSSFSGWFWEVPGDHLISAELQIGTSEGDNSLFDQTVSFTQGSCQSNVYGFSVCQENSSFNGPGNLSPGTNYWVTLQNGNTALGQSIYWDENSGIGCRSLGCPSSASENTIGTIPSEAFTITTNSSVTCGGDCVTGTPEPSSIMLFGTGMLGIVGVLRRKLL